MILFQSRRTMLVQGFALALGLQLGGASTAGADALDDVTGAGTIRSASSRISRLSLRSART
jgi:hypothetical protein